ncbi:MAG: DUF3795 domain-containing protein [Anaerolineae bacterium]
MSEELMGACGIDCETCGLRIYPTDAKAAEEVLDWFHSEGWLKAEEGLAEALERKMTCTGCHGPRDTHWSCDCWIRQCAVEQRGLENCSQCPDLPCERLVAWSTENEGYAAGLERLRGLAAAR